MRIKKLHILLIVSICAWLDSTAFSQTRCVEFRHIEFFVPTDPKIPNWSESQIRQLIAMKTGDSQTFFVPFIVKQLAEYEPGCGKRVVDNRFELLLKLYSSVRPYDLQASKQSAHQKLELIRKDFQKQINDDRLFKGLIYTTDDGPLMGKTVSLASVRPVTSREYATPFGKLRFANMHDGVAVVAIDKYGRSIWARVLVGVVPDRTLREANLKSLTVEQTDFVIVARVFVDGERLTLYVRPNGRFMYYTHSW